MRKPSLPDLALTSFILAAAAIPSFSAAQSVTDCDQRARPDAIVEPWSANSRSFSNGAVRVALLDSIEPASGAFDLLVLSPPRDQMGARQCRLVSLDGALGFAALDFAAMRASYNPARGLTLRLTGKAFSPADGVTRPIRLSVTINQATGKVSAKVRPAGK